MSHMEGKAMMIWAFISIDTKSILKEINQVLHFRDKRFTSCDGLNSGTAQEGDHVQVRKSVGEDFLHLTKHRISQDVKLSQHLQ